MQTMRSLCAVLSIAALAAGCTKAPRPRKDAPAMTEHDAPAAAAGPTVVTTFAEVKAAAGKLVRVSGKVFREKLGDGVMVDGLDILCPDLRLPEDVVEAALEGRLELWEPPVAETNAKGEISQGVAEATARWVLRDCGQT